MYVAGPLIGITAYGLIADVAFLLVQQPNIGAFSIFSGVLFARYLLVNLNNLLFYFIVLTPKNDTSPFILNKKL